jgi:membrane protein
VVQQALSSAQAPSEGITASLFAFALLLFGATGVFAELQDAFERLWRQGSGEVPQQKWWHSASLRLRGVAYILAFGFLLLVSLAISTFLGLLVGLGGQLPADRKSRLGAQRSRVFRFLRCIVCGAHENERGPQAGFTLSGDGAAAGAILFAVGKHLMAFYLSTAAVVSAYGAAGSLVVILMWIYFSSAVLLLAASVARAWADEAREPPPVSA